MTPPANRRSDRLQGVAPTHPDGLQLKPRVGGNGYMGRGSNSEVAALLSRSAPALKNKFRKQKKYLSPSKTEVKETSEAGSALKLITNTVRKRVFVRSFKALLQPNGVDAKPVEVTFFQTEESALSRKKEVKITADLEKVKAKIERPASRLFKVESTAITTKILADAAQQERKYSSNIPAKDVAAAFGHKGKGAAYDRSHACAHSHGAFPAKPVLPKKKKNRSAKSYITFAAREEHNTMRMVSVENRKVRGYIERFGKLYYTNEVELHADKKGPIPIIKEEAASWHDEQGNTVKFIFDPDNGVTPAVELGKFTESVLEEVFDPVETPKRQLKF